MQLSKILRILKDLLRFLKSYLKNLSLSQVDIEGDDLIQY